MIYRAASKTHYSLFRSRKMPFTSLDCIIIITFRRCVEIITYKLGHSAQILKQISASTAFLIYYTTNNAIFFLIIFSFSNFLKCVLIHYDLSYFYCSFTSHKYVFSPKRWNSLTSFG